MSRLPENTPRIASGGFALPEHPRGRSLQSLPPLRARKRRCRSSSSSLLRSALIGSDFAASKSNASSNCESRASSAGVRWLGLPRLRMVMLMFPQSEGGEAPCELVRLTVREAVLAKHLRSGGINVATRRKSDAHPAVAKSSAAATAMVGSNSRAVGEDFMGHVTVSVLMPTYNATSRYMSNAILRYGENNSGGQA